MLTHGMSRSKPYQVWANMRRRCLNPKDSAFPGYGGRGIKICGRWKCFESFWEDMKGGYSPGLVLDRVDNDSGYSPKNCRWVSFKESNRNTRGSVLIDTPRGRMTLGEASEVFGIKYTTLRHRFRAGLDLFCPLGEARR